MMRIATILLLIGVAMPAAAINECDPSYIGWALDEGSGSCCMSVEQPGVGFDIYLYAGITGCLEGITELSFSIPNWPDRPDNPGGIIVYEWLADEVIGDIATGITLRWNEPAVLHSYEYIGVASMLPFDSEWLGTNLTLTPQDVVITSPGVCIQDAIPNSFHINCDGMEFCECPWNACDWPGDYVDAFLWTENVTPADETEVPSQFNMNFDVWSFGCDSPNGWNFEGELLLAGEQVATFAGSGLEQFSLPVDASAYAEGDTIEVHIHLWLYYYMGGILPDWTRLEYTITESTPANRETWSALKIRY